MLKPLVSVLDEMKKNQRMAHLDEASIKQAIVLRCLHILGWNVYDVEEVIPEYAVESRRVDIALRASGRNLAFLEVKKGGEDLDRHQEQLLDYAFREGIDLAILTNGFTWWFFLPKEQGSWTDRRFYVVDISEQPSEEAASHLESLMLRGRLLSGEALNYAKKIHKSKMKRTSVLKTLPEAWNRIVRDRDSLLVELLTETTERMCGHRPDPSDVHLFLNRYRPEIILPQSPRAVPRARLRQTGGGESLPKTSHTKKLSARDFGIERILARVAPDAEKVDRSTYKISRGRHITIRCSKRLQQGNWTVYWFGMGPSTFDRFPAGRLFVFLICGGERDVVVLPGEWLRRLFQDTKTARDGQWKFTVKPVQGRWEIRVSGKHPEDVTKFLNKYEILR